jgi:hypothetical protein
MTTPETGPRAALRFGERMLLVAFLASPLLGLGLWWLVLHLVGVL